jgi:MFS family permease
MWRQRSTRNICIALVLFYAFNAGLAPWYAAFMIRSHGMGTAELGVWLGAIFGGAGIVGTLLGAQIANRWLVGNERGQMRMAAVGVALLLPSFVAFLTLPGRYQALLSLVPLMILATLFIAPTYALMQRLVADDMRATTLSITMMFANLIGMGVGPQIVGILSDLLAPTLGKEALRFAMLSMSLVSLWVAYQFWLVGTTVSEDLLKLRESTSEVHSQ